MEPERPEWADWLWRAWADLDGERPMIQAGMGGAVPGRIPWSALDRWARRYGVTGFDFDLLTRAVSVMDTVLLSHAVKGRS
jgi:hypothetical protein